MSPGFGVSFPIVAQGVFDEDSSLSRHYPDICDVEEHVRNTSERSAKNNHVSVTTTDPSGKLTQQDIINCVKILHFKSWAPNEAYFSSNGIKRIGSSLSCSQVQKFNE